MVEAMVSRYVSVEIRWQESMAKLTTEQNSDIVFQVWANFSSTSEIIPLYPKMFVVEVGRRPRSDVRSGYGQKDFCKEGLSKNNGTDP